MCWLTVGPAQGHPLTTSVRLKRRSDWSKAADFGKSLTLPFFTRRWAAATVIVMAALLLMPSCSDYPRDVEKTLDTLQSGVLRVGVVENPPWVIRGSSGPEGLEPEILRNLAARLNAEVQWYWGSTAVMIQALEQHQVHVVIGGLTSGPRLPKTVAVTKPYYTTRYTVGFPPSRNAMPASLEGLSIAVPAISPLRKTLRDKQAELLPVGNLETPGLPMAGPTWWLEAHGLRPGPWELLKQKQVMVVAKGENAWIGALQHHLNGVTDVDKRLRQLEASP